MMWTHLGEALCLSAVAGGPLTGKEPEGTAAERRGNEARVSGANGGPKQTRRVQLTGGARTSCETS